MYLDWAKNMGGRYLVFRAGYEVKRRTGLLDRRFPMNPDHRQFPTLEHWRKSAPLFFFASKEDVQLGKKPDKTLQRSAKRITAGIYPFFSAQELDLGQSYNWLTHPLSDYQYPKTAHWTRVPDYDKEIGDIKYIWEPSRFSWLYTLIRDDYHHDIDHGFFVFQKIDSWISQNPINQGPNWRCSQEIGLRLLNWTFALYYYRFHPALTDDLFQRILHFLYWKWHHIYKNIDFSRIAVRNNHALTETLVIYLGGLLFPFFPEAGKWGRNGKKWFEEEIAYQIYPDGSYIQHSFNYQRVAVQLLSWGIRLSELHKDNLSPVVYDRAQVTLSFLEQMQIGENGEVPNYGNNDGALFFPWSNYQYTDFRPQLDGLRSVLSSMEEELHRPLFEEGGWFLNRVIGKHLKSEKEKEKTDIKSFPVGGYYTARTANIFNLIRCTGYKDRPAQADNLHLDLWIKGENVLLDAGTYLYNAESKWLNWFGGTASHNTVTLANHHQMKKGSRFIWFFWPRFLKGDIEKTINGWEFTGKINCFRQLGMEIIHERTVHFNQEEMTWNIKDKVVHQTGLPIIQHWHPNVHWLNKLQFFAVDENGDNLNINHQNGWYSDHYGVKKKTPWLSFQTNTSMIQTKISCK